MAKVLKVKDRSGNVVPGRFKVMVSFGSEHNGTRRFRSETVSATTRTIKEVAAEVEARLRADDARQRAADELAEEAGPPDADPEPAKPGTFAEAAERYVRDGVVTAGWSAKHLASREREAELIAASPLGSVPMRELRREHLVEHLGAWAATPTGRGTARSAASVKARRVFIGAVVAFALADPDTELRGNPAAKLGAAKLGVKARKVADRDVPTVADFGRILNRAAARWQADIDRRVNGTGYRGKLGYIGRAELFADFTTFMLWSGMRPGELCALQAHKVTMLDDGSALVRVDRSVEPTKGGGFTLKATKTEDERTVPVHAAAAAILQRRLDASELAAMADEVEAKPRRFVFAMGWGTEALTPTATTHWWAKLRSFEPGLDGLRLYDLRHSHCSELHALGLHDAAIAERMGHSIEVSNSTYNHARPGAELALAKAIEQAAAR
jgi:integrase